MDSREIFELLSQLEQIFNFQINFDEIDYLLKNNKILTIKDLISYLECKKF